MREANQEHTSQHVAPQLDSIFAPPPQKMAKRNFDLLYAYVHSYFLTSLHFYLLCSTCPSFGGSTVPTSYLHAPFQQPSIGLSRHRGQGGQG